jgi:predicted nucleic acid-binding protein
MPPIHQLDASAAAMLVLNEDGSDDLKRYFVTRSRFYITSLCLAEAFSVLKRKHDRKQLSPKEYINKAFLLRGYVNSRRIRLNEATGKLFTIATFNQAADYAVKHTVDLSDALQLLLLKHGPFSGAIGESKTIFITADGSLAKAARTEGLRVWNCRQAKNPPKN